MSGSVHLYAPGDLDHPAVKACHLNGVPGYFLIDKNVKLINNNAPGMGELVINTSKEIDEALAR